jgi:hypothetical protein
VRVAQLAEAVRLIKRLWTGEPVDFEGRHYRVRGGRCLPRPACIDTLKRKAAQGISYFVCLFTDGGQPDTVRLFGEKVLPAFR